MCGIFGVFGRPLSEPAIAGALAALAPRGPDGQGARRLAEDAVMGHTRLAIIDLAETADQPMDGLDGRLTLVFNGEIYNAPALRAAIPDYPWRTDHSDTETILAAYWKWGDAFVEHLRGMFALALWDRAEDRLLLAVDRFSIKPLYLHEDAGALAFASTASAIAATGVPLRPDLATVHTFLDDGVLETTERTFFAGITQLLPATLAVWQGGRLTRRQYWERPLAAEAAPRDVPLDEVEAWIDESLSSHLLSDVPVGLCLSSGLDSNLLRVRAQALGHTLPAFSFGFPGTVYDEPGRIAPLLGGHPATATPVDPAAMWDDLVEATRRIELPLGGVAIYGHYLNARAARDAGHKVLLAGEGSDEIFGGYRYYAETAIARLWRDGRAAEAADLLAAFQAREPGAWPATAEALVARLDAQAGAARAPDGTTLNETFLSRDFAATAKLPPVPTADGDPVRAGMWTDLRHTKLPKLLRWQDRCYMAAGVEVRVPFLDHVLAERAAALPVETMFSGGTTKAHLRRLAQRHLPAAFLDQPKLYVATPQREWLKEDLAERIGALLTPDAALARHGLIDMDRLRARWQAWRTEPALGNSFFLWKVIVSEALFQAFFEPEARP